MIPKIAYFPWSGGPMGWLRRTSAISFESLNPDWEIRIIRTHKSVPNGLGLVQQADWSAYAHLYETGGFRFDTDIVFVKPVPPEWTDTDLCATLNIREKVCQIAGIGCRKDHGFFRRVLEACKASDDRVRSRYEGLGIELLSHLGHPSHCKPFFDQPIDGLCPFRHHEVEKIWAEADYELGSNTIGVHWYGGHELSRVSEGALPENSYIVKLAEEAR